MNSGIQADPAAGQLRYMSGELRKNASDPLLSLSPQLVDQGFDIFLIYPADGSDLIFGEVRQCCCIGVCPDLVRR
jgi:hypothetical protein